MPSASTDQSPPVGFWVFVTTAATWISLSVTPLALTCTFFLRSSGLMEIGVLPPPFGIVDADLPLDPAFPHAAASRAIDTPTTRNRARMLPPWETFEVIEG